MTIFKIKSGTKAHSSQNETNRQQVRHKCAEEFGQRRCNVDGRIDEIDGVQEEWVGNAAFDQQMWMREALKGEINERVTFLRETTHKNIC